MPKRVAILMSDTGGGHRAAAEAVQEALALEYGERVTVELIDVFLKYTPYPFNRFPLWYPAMISRGSRVWDKVYRLSNGARRSRAISIIVYPYVRWAIRRMLREHPADVIVCVHSLFVLPIIRALGRTRPPVITVVTDLVTVHAWWFHPAIDFTIVPTEAARQRGIRNHIHPTRIKTIGLPVAEKFAHPRGPTAALRDQLGWQQDTITILLLGGGEGMGPLRDITTGLAAAGLPLQLAVVCGRNETLRAELAAHDWPVPVHVYGFMANMPDLMQAADLVVTKAGPSSVIEALNSGLPIVLSGAIPGQEDGNVSYVVDEGVGLWAPGPDKVVAAVQTLLADSPARLAQMTARARRLARPNAARQIAREIARFFMHDPLEMHETRTVTLQPVHTESDIVR